MKKIIIFLLIFFCFFVIANQAKAEVINNFEASIKINADATINVTEKITYDFGDISRHGIFRDLPVVYQRNGNNYKLEINNLAVTDESGNDYPFTTSKVGSNLEIKIGDPNVLISGEKIYVLNYKVNWAINYFSDQDELYWNITGNDWPVAINQSSALIILSTPIEETVVQKTCFAGLFDSQNPCSDISLNKNNNLVDSALFKNNNLNINEGLTVVVGFPKGLVMEPSQADYFKKSLKENYKLIFLIILPFVVLLFLFYRFRKTGRDLPGRGTIIPQYEPPDNLTPAEIGTIIDETADNRDITADIINLAVKGYLKIQKVTGDNDYILTKLKSEADLGEEFERELMKSIFGVANDTKLSSLKYKFYKDLAKIKKIIYQLVVDKGYFLKNPQTVRMVYISIGAAVSFFGFFFGGVFGPLGIFSFLISGLIFIVFSKFMPAKTRKGAIAKENILGLKMYLTVAEKERIKFHNAPAKNPQTFEKLLPYAMSLKVEKEWAKQFEGIYTTAPSWYNDPSGGVFNAIIFANAMHSFSTGANSILAATPHSSAGGGGSGFGGGGFSGGGFGGGGGGSW